MHRFQRRRHNGGVPVELPELFTVTAAEYEAIHSAWNKAVKVLPDYSIVHKQDWFIKENYAPDIQKDDLSFLPVPLNGILMKDRS